MNELIRYVKYNSEKLGFLKLRNKFFDRLRNRGFRKYFLTKIFSVVSDSQRNKYLNKSEKIYSNVVQETRAEAAITEVAEDILNIHLVTDQILDGEPTGTSTELKGAISPENEVGKNTSVKVFETKTKVDYSLGFVFPGECHELKRKIQDIFNQEMLNAAKNLKHLKTASKLHQLVLYF